MVIPSSIMDEYLSDARSDYFTGRGVFRVYWSKIKHEVYQFEADGPKTWVQFITVVFPVTKVGSEVLDGRLGVVHFLFPVSECLTSFEAHDNVIKSGHRGWGTKLSFDFQSGILTNDSGTCRVLGTEYVSWDEVREVTGTNYCRITQDGIIVKVMRPAGLDYPKVFTDPEVIPVIPAAASLGVFRPAGWNYVKFVHPKSSMLVSVKVSGTDVRVSYWQSGLVDQFYWCLKSEKFLGMAPAGWTTKWLVRK